MFNRSLNDVVKGARYKCCSYSYWKLEKNRGDLSFLIVLKSLDTPMIHFFVKRDVKKDILHNI